MTYLDAMCTGTPDGLLAVPNKQNCLDLCMTVQEYIRDTRWELGASTPLPLSLAPVALALSSLRTNADSRALAVQDAARILQKLIKQQPGTPSF